jgi:hypothetical protein
MNPPVNRENLRDVLIALVVASGLAWVVGVFEGARPMLPLQYHLLSPNSSNSRR